MLSSHGLCRLKIDTTNICNELDLPKGVLKSVGGGWAAIYALRSCNVNESMGFYVMLIK